MILNPLCDDFQHATQVLDLDHATTQLSVFISPKLLITHHLGSLVGIREVMTYLERHVLKPHHGSDFVLHLIIDGIIDRYRPLLDSLEEHFNQLEEVVFVAPENPSCRILSGLSV